MLRNVPPHLVAQKNDIEELVKLGREAGFTLVEENPIPASQDPCVAWQGQPLHVRTERVQEVRGLALRVLFPEDGAARRGHWG